MRDKEPQQRRRPTKIRLTDRVIRGVKPPKNGAEFVYDSELPFFGLRTLASGTKAFVYGYRNADERLHRMTLGRWPALTATAARLRAREIAAKVAAGGYPFEERQAKRAENTLAELVDLYERKALSKLRRGDEAARHLRSDVLPSLGAKTKPSSITRRDIVRLVDEKAINAPIAANRLLSHVKGLFSWAVEKGEITGDPASGIKPTKEKSRDRVLSEDEIRALWEALPGARLMTEGTRTALRLVLLTAQRPGEVCAMERSELDSVEGWWQMPREKTKSDRAHRVPLTGMALDLIQRQPKADRWVFASVKGQSLRRLALSHAVRRNNHFGLTRWTPHDLRRTAVTHMAKLGVDKFVRERILNHSQGKMDTTYDLYTYDREKRSALEKWERKLKSIIGEPVEARVLKFKVRV